MGLFAELNMAREVDSQALRGLWPARGARRGPGQFSRLGTGLVAIAWVVALVAILAVGPDLGEQGQLIAWKLLGLVVLAGVGLIAFGLYRVGARVQRTHRLGGAARGAFLTWAASDVWAWLALFVVSSLGDVLHPMPHAAHGWGPVLASNAPLVGELAALYFVARLAGALSAERAERRAARAQ